LTKPRADLPEGGPLRVLWVVKGLGPGGAERLLVNQAAASDGDVAYEAVYLVPEKSHLVPELEALGVACTLLDSRVPGGWLVELRSRLRDRPVDVVHVHSPALAAGIRPMVRTLGSRRPAMMYTEHNRWPRHHPVTRLANRLTYGLDDDHVAVSDEVRETIDGRHRGSVDVVVHGIDLEGARAQASAGQEVRDELGIGPDEVVIGTVANLRVQKGYDVLLRAARQVVDQVPEARFVAVGQGPLADQVDGWHREQELGDRFLLLGYRPDAVRMMSGFDVFVLASTHEGLPVALMEAMALGLPLVATSVGGIPQAVTDGVEGILVPSGDPTALAAAMVELARDPERRRARGRAAGDRAQAFSAARATAELENRYRSLARR
jgi:glycosyltransferase involved in cell wall biosynthesis